MKKTILKSLSYRTMSVLITSAIIYATTGDTSSILAIVGADSVVKLGAFSIHETMWEKISG